MKLMALLVVTSVMGASAWLWHRIPPAPVAIELQGPIPAQTRLSSTPRAQFTPNTRKGYYSIDVVGDFTIPSTKKIIFNGAGRNLHVDQDRTKLFRRGFSAVERSRMVPNVEVWPDENTPRGWQSKLSISQRAYIVYRNYFTQSFGLAWAENSEKAPETIYKNTSPTATDKNNIYQACVELRGHCYYFGDCGPNGNNWKATFGTIILDMENSFWIKHEQEHANLHTFLMKTLQENVSPETELGSADLFAHNSFGYSRAIDYTAQPDALFRLPAKHTTTSRQRGMPDEIVGKSPSDYTDFLMPGTYYLYPEMNYAERHLYDGDRHWLAALLGEQEVNMKMSTKKRIAWQWLFNQQNAEFANNAQANHPAPPAIAEGTAIFYWFTGAYGVMFWDDHKDLIPDQPLPTDPNERGLGNDRNYACYEHYIHGLWRIFGHHSDLFNGKETYLNEATECSYDGGKTWYGYNANQIKTRDLPFARAIVNGNQILVAATKAYAQPNQKSQIMVRYVQNGYQFYTTINLKGDEIYLGRATMKRAGVR
ncbi:hypothetical protein [Spirosoma validum]|uniref:Uncharacterized protein n=1 Tax=Spirosoma validum TaxID=2771355 RepID=A0A927B6J1_9BACT|nr:hypothetical protein [Spirosoma validum]MBD2756620.1 hypothetical protein [Spirosoma validum]